MFIEVVDLPYATLKCYWLDHGYLMYYNIHLIYYLIGKKCFMILLLKQQCIVEQH